MSRIKEYRAARGTLEMAISTLVDRARTFNNDTCPYRLRELLAAGREYGRALSRVERMRCKK